MIADAGSNRVFEVAPDGTIVWEFSGLAPEKNELFEHLGPTYVDRIDNGNTLISGRGVDRIIEVDQAGDIIWEVGAPLIDAQFRKRDKIWEERTPPETLINTGFLQK